MNFKSETNDEEPSHEDLLQKLQNNRESDDIIEGSSQAPNDHNHNQEEGDYYHGECALVIGDGHDKDALNHSNLGRQYLNELELLELAIQADAFLHRGEKLQGRTHDDHAGEHQFE